MRQSSSETSGFLTIQEIFLHFIEPENSSRLSVFWVHIETQNWGALW
jgi:hypothetical protein